MEKERTSNLSQSSLSTSSNASSTSKKSADKKILIPTKPSGNKQVKIQNNNINKKSQQDDTKNSKQSKTEKNNETLAKNKNERTNQNTEANGKLQNGSRDVHLISRLVKRKLENYMNVEQRENRFNVQGSYVTTRKMHEYDLSYKLIQNGPMDKKGLKKQAKEEQNGNCQSCILPKLCTNSRRVVLSFEADQLTETANTIFESSPMKKLTIVHRYRPFSREQKCATNGHIQNYRRHVMNALQVEDYINFYKQNELDSGNPQNTRLSGLKKSEQKAEKKENSKNKPKALPQKSRSRHSSTTTVDSYSTNFSSESRTSTLSCNSSEGNPAPKAKKWPALEHNSTSGADDEYSTTPSRNCSPAHSSASRSSVTSEKPSKNSRSTSKNSSVKSNLSPRPPSSKSSVSRASTKTSQPSPSSRKQAQGSNISDSKASNKSYSEVSKNSNENRSQSSIRSESAKSINSEKSKQSIKTSEQKSSDDISLFQNAEPLSTSNNETATKTDDDDKKDEEMDTQNESDGSQPSSPEPSKTERDLHSRPISASSRQEMYATVEHSIEGSMSSRKGSRVGSAKSNRSRIMSASSNKSSHQTNEDERPTEIKRKTVEASDSKNNNETEEEIHSNLTDEGVNDVGKSERQLSSDKSNDVILKDDNDQSSRSEPANVEENDNDSISNKSNESKSESCSLFESDEEQKEPTSVQDVPKGTDQSDDTNSNKRLDDSYTALGTKPPKDYISVKPKEKDDFFD